MGFILGAKLDSEGFLRFERIIKMARRLEEFQQDGELQALRTEKGLLQACMDGIRTARSGWILQKKFIQEEATQMLKSMTDADPQANMTAEGKKLTRLLQSLDEELKELEHPTESESSVEKMIKTIEKEISKTAAPT